MIADEVPLAGSAFGEANLSRLIEMTRDPDRSNRDWAALLLSQQDLDSPEIRSALLAAARDEDECVRAEALCGLAARDPAAALPLLHEALASDRVNAPVFEAAALVAHPSLAEPLRAFAEPSDDGFLDQLVLEALAACEGAGEHRVAHHQSGLRAHPSAPVKTGRRAGARPTESEMSAVLCLSGESRNP